MKVIKSVWGVFSGVFTLLLVLSACVFHPVYDTRSPADATATAEANAAIATATQAIIEATLVATPAPECLVKGNINRKGEKIYHVAGQANYDRTVIDPEHGEMWFCNPTEAEGAGWRAALR